MPIADLYNPPETPTEKDNFDQHHADHHRRLIDLVFQTTGRTLAEYVLDPFNIANSESGLQHQQMHNDLDAIFGTSGYDLTDVDWKDAGQRASWIWLNAQAHVAYAEKTGVW